MKKFLSLILVLSMASTFVLSGCTQNNEEPTNQGASTSETTQNSKSTDNEATTDKAKETTIRIAWWGNQTRDERTNQVLDMYAKENPGVKFEAEPVAWSGYWDKLATQTAANSLPDIIQQDYAYIGQYIDKNVLTDLTPFAESGVLELSDVNENNLQGGRSGDGLYGIPLGMNALALLYDPAMLKDAGIDSINPDWIWEDFEQIATQIHDKTGLQVDAPLDADPKFLLEYRVRQEGKTVYNADGTGLGFDDPAVLVTMFEQLQRLTEAGVYPKPEIVRPIQTLEEGLFPTGKTAMAIGWSNFFVAYSNAANKPLEMTVLPSTEGGNPGLYLKPSQFFSVTESSEIKEDAAKVINYFTNSVEANNILLAERGIPIAAKVRDGIASNVSEQVAQTFEYIALAENYAGPIDPPEPVGAAEVTTLLKETYDEVWYMQTTPEEAAERFMKEANAILAKNK